MITVAIVPILVPAGSALLATIFAGAGSALATLRPAHWLRASRQKPVIAGLILLSALVTVAGVWQLPTLVHRVRLRLHPRWDWEQIALNTIRSEQLGQTAQSPASGAPRHLRLAWEFKQPGASFLSTPVLQNGHLYSASCVFDVGNTFGSIFCLDATTGTPIWQVEKIDNRELKGIFSSPALTADGKYLIIGEGLHSDAGCHLICLEAATGKLHWKIDVPKNHVESSPAISGDFTVVGAGAIERFDHLPVDSTGYALCVRISDGNVLWKQEVIDPESSPALSADAVTYIGSGVNGCAIVAIRANGERLWKTSTPHPATGPVSIANNLVVVGTGRGDMINADRHPAGAVIAVDRLSGQIKWQTELSDAVLGRIAIGDSKAFCPVRNGTIVALDLKDGKKLWSKAISDSPVVAGTATSGEYVYAVTSKGALVILDSNTGRVLESDELNDQANPGRQNLSLGAPLVTDGKVFVGSETGGLRCFLGTPSR